MGAARRVVEQQSEVAAEGRHEGLKNTATVASTIDGAVVNLKKQLDRIKDPTQRKAVIDALTQLRNAVNAELEGIRPAGKVAVPPWVVTTWV